MQDIFPSVTVQAPNNVKSNNTSIISQNNALNRSNGKNNNVNNQRLKVLNTNQERKKSISSQSNIMSVIQQINSTKSKNNKLKQQQKITQMKQDITNMINQNKDRYLLYSDTSFAPKQKFRGRFPSPAERSKQKMTEDYDQMTNFSHYRRKSCMCETCGLLTNTIIQRLDEKAPPRLIPNNYFYQKAKKQNQKVKQKQKKIIKPFLNLKNKQKQQNNNNNVQMSESISKQKKIQFLQKGVSSRNILLSGNQLSESQNNNNSNTLNVFSQHHKLDSSQKSPQGQRKSMFISPSPKSFLGNSSGNKSPQIKENDNIAQQPPVIDRSRKIKQLTFFQNSQRVIKQQNFQKALDDESIEQQDSSQEQQESENEDSQDKKSQDSDNEKQEFQKSVQSPSVASTQKQVLEVPQKIEVTSPKKKKSFIHSPVKKESEKTQEKQPKMGKKKKKKKIVKKEKPNFLFNILKQVKQNDEQQIKLYTDVFALEQPVIQQKNENQKNLKKFRKVINKLSLFNYLKKQQKYDEEMGDQYYELLNMVGTDKYKQIVEDSDSEDEKNFVYKQKKNQVIKIPHVKNQITKSFLDMYRIRPNTTVTNYVTTNNSNKKAIQGSYLQQIIEQQANEDKQQNQDDLNFYNTGIPESGKKIQQQNQNKILMQSQPLKKQKNDINFSKNSHNNQRLIHSPNLNQSKKNSTQTDIFQNIKSPNERNRQQTKKITYNQCQDLPNAVLVNQLRHQDQLHSFNFQKNYKSPNKNQELEQNTTIQSKSLQQSKLYGIDPNKSNKINPKSLKQLHYELDFGENFFINKHKSQKDIKSLTTLNSPREIEYFSKNGDLQENINKVQGQSTDQNFYNNNQRQIQSSSGLHSQRQYLVYTSQSRQSSRNANHYRISSPQLPKSTVNNNTLQQYQINKGIKNLNFQNYFTSKNKNQDQNTNSNNRISNQSISRYNNNKLGIQQFKKLQKI